MKRILLAVGIVLLGLIGIIYVSVSSTSKEFETCTIHNFEAVEDIDFKKHKTVQVSASNLYESDVLKDVIQGENYREAWATPIEAPIVFLDTLYGGMSIVKEGGGKQTHSLRLMAKDSTLYSLRSINKNPKKLIPEFARTLGLENIVVDGISAQHPYAAPVVAKLADVVGVLHTHPKVVFVPKQESLGQFNDKYGNRLYLLEYETEGKINWTDLPDIIEIVDTEDLQELKMDFPQRVQIDKSALVRARLFDLIIGDWDRHAKQWGWAIAESDGMYRGFPVPGDRDNAFFNVDGMIPSIISNKNVVAEVRPFQKDIDFMGGLIYDFDVYFLQNTPETIFLEQAQHIQATLSDKKIAQAFEQWNEQLHRHHAQNIISKIKARRTNLVELSLEFKKVLDNRPLLSQPLKGSERDDVNASLLKCFDCLQ